LKTQYDRLSEASQPDHYLPTEFGQDGQLLYKFLDSNVFAIITRKVSDPSTVTVNLINGVTGRIIHSFI